MIAEAIRNGYAAITVRGRFFKHEWSRAYVTVSEPEPITGERGVTIMVPGKSPEVYPLNRVLVWQPLSEH